MSTIVSTEFLLGQAIISNGLTTGNGWSNPNNLLLVDGDTSDSDVSQASDVIVGNFNFNIPQNAVVTGIELKVIGYRGAQVSPPITLTPYAVDNTSGQNLYYPYITPFSGFTTSMAEYTLGTQNYLYGTTWTVDQINNFKIQLVSNGALFIDAVLVKVYYYETTTPPEPDPGDSCIDCQSQIQAQPFELALPVKVTDTKIYVKSFNLPDGTPITNSDLGSCGGDIDIVMDQGKPKGNGQPYEENAKVLTITQMPNGTVELDFGSITNRGLQFVTPYGHDIDLISEHNANGEVVISNNAPFYNKFLKKCHIDVLVSPPIVVQDEGITQTPTLHILNFRGQGVFASPDMSDPDKINVDIAGFQTTPPVVVGVGTGTSGNTQVTSLTFPLTTSGVNRGCLVQVSTQQNVTVTGVTFNAVPLAQQIADTNVGNTIRSEQWFLVAPPVGTFDIVITLSGPAYISAGAEALVNIDQGNPVGATNSAKATSFAPSVTLVTTTDNSLVFDGLVTAQTPMLYTVGPGQVLNWSHTSNLDTRQGASSYELAGLFPDNVVMSYAITQNTSWVITAIEINGIPGSTPVVSPLTVEDEGVPVDTSVVNINFTGGGVTATQTAPGFVEVNIPAAPGGFVESVTDDGNGHVTVDNTDPVNPIIEFDGVSTDGVTITGTGLAGDPLVVPSSGASDFVVNADEAVTDWTTNQVPSPVNGGDRWTFSSAPSGPVYGNGSNASVSGGVSGSFRIQDTFWGGNQQDLEFGFTPRIYKAKFALQTSSNGVASGVNAFIGFATTGDNALGDITNTSRPRIGLSFYDDGHVYATTCNGVATTTTDLGTFNSTIHGWTLQVQNGTSAKFYNEDGTLVATISATLPSSGATKFFFAGINGGGGGAGFNYLSNVVISQKTQ